ncbi:hypothetical protein ZWY2020_060126 [Hordeum vulgare]|nr:hypothetical protein ZWY2020_060126 [Hordeum vulgare]
MQDALFYAPDMPTTQCCEPVVAAVDLGGGVPCLCRVAAEHVGHGGLNATSSSSTPPVAVSRTAPALPPLAKENTVTLDNQENNKEGQETSVATRYVMGIGEADAFSERLKKELVALEAANVYQLVESEPLIEEEKASYFTNAEKLKVEYTSRTRIRRATSGEGVRSLWNSSVID